jgi:hypothetical protein
MDWHSLVTQAPSAAAVIATVMLFLKFLSRETSRRAEQDRRQHELIQKVAVDCHSHTEALNQLATDAITKAAGVIEKNTEVLGAHAEIIRGVERRMNGHKG